MMAGRGFFPPGKGGRRGFPLIGDDFGYFGPNDKPPFHPEFGYPPHFPPPPDGFFPGGPMGFMGKFYDYAIIKKHHLHFSKRCNTT